MPTWTQPELERALPLCYNLTFTDYYEWFVKYGGNIHLILQQSDEYINKAFEFQPSIIPSIFTQGPVSPDPHLIYILCHINPSKKRALALTDPTSTTTATATATTSTATTTAAATSTTGSELSVLPVATSTATTTDLSASDKSMKETSAATIHRQSLEFDDGEVSFTFASDYIFERIKERYRDDAICIAVRHFC